MRSLKWSSYPINKHKLSHLTHLETTLNRFNINSLLMNSKTDLKVLEYCKLQILSKIFTMQWPIQAKIST